MQAPTRARIFLPGAESASMSQPSLAASEAGLWKVVETFAVVCFLVTLAVMFIQVASRYALGIAVPWTDETSRFLFIAAIFSGAALCQRRAAQIRITVLLDILPQRLRRWFEMLSDVFTALIALALVVGCAEMARSAGNQRAATLPITFAWLYILQGITLFLVFAVALRDVLRALGRPAP